MNPYLVPNANTRRRDADHDVEPPRFDSKVVLVHVKEGQFLSEKTKDDGSPLNRLETYPLEALQFLPRRVNRRF
jgi:hypothetical protein